MQKKFVTKWFALSYNRQKGKHIDPLLLVSSIINFTKILAYVFLFFAPFLFKSVEKSELYFAYRLTHSYKRVQFILKKKKRSLFISKIEHKLEQCSFLHAQIYFFFPYFFQ